MQIGLNMMVNQEETIKSLQREVLRLKLTCHNYERQLSNSGRALGLDLDETKRDLIADLMEANDELKTQLNDRNQEESQKEHETVEVACQTNLDRFGIARLIEDSLTLKKQKKLHSDLTEQFQQVKQSLLYHQTIIHQMQQPQAHQHTHQQAPTHHIYQNQPARPLQRQPTSSRDQQTTSGKNMTLDEKGALDKLFKLDGLLTTARDKLRAAVFD